MLYVCGTSPVSSTIQCIYQATYIRTYIHTYIHSLAWTTNSPHSLILHIHTHTCVYAHTCVDTSSHVQLTALLHTGQALAGYQQGQLMTAMGQMPVMQTPGYTKPKEGEI